MSSSKFETIEHRVPCSYIREYPRAVAVSQEDQLYLSVKQYRPLSNPRPQPGDITILGAHANGFAKELYEPLWDDLLDALERAGAPFRIRSIWIADAAHQGASYALNEAALGNDPSWFDHPRDLAHLVNLHRADMPRPIFGLGHSMGGAHLAALALAHPRLLAGLILLDPVVQARSAEVDSSGGRTRPNLATLSTFRRDLWPSREDARRAFASSAFYRAWDPRVLDAWITHGLRDCPTLLHPKAAPGSVTLATPPAQEVYTFLRPNFAGYGRGGGVEPAAAGGGKPVNRSTHADLDPANTASFPFYRAEPPALFNRLPEVRPPVLYVSGATSQVSNPALDRDRLARTGAGVGGSGGAAEGRVELVTFEGVGHLIAQEAPGRTAEEAARWLAAEVALWAEEERKLEREWFGKGSVKERQEISDEWKRHVGGPPKRAGAKEKL